jgi:hypothetical protein
MFLKSCRCHDDFLKNLSLPRRYRDDFLKTCRCHAATATAAAMDISDIVVI